MWKIGSRCEDSNPNASILPIFEGCGVVFILGNESERFKRDVLKGDLFAISRGSEIVKIATATSKVKEVPEIVQKKIEPNRNKFSSISDEVLSRVIDDNNAGCYGTEVEIISLKESIKYGDRSQFCEIQKQNVIQAIEKALIQLIPNGNLSKIKQKQDIIERINELFKIYKKYEKKFFISRNPNITNRMR
jgi:hypothetical protein